MSFMRDIEGRLYPIKSVNIEDEISFREFLDIKFDDRNELFFLLRIIPIVLIFQNLIKGWSLHQ